MLQQALAKGFSQSTLLSQDLKGWEDKMCTPKRNLPSCSTQACSGNLKHLQCTHFLSTCKLYVLPWDGSFRNQRALLCPWELLPTGSWCCFFHKCLWSYYNRVPLTTSLCASSFQPHTRSLGQLQGYCRLLEAICPCKVMRNHHCQVTLSTTYLQVA